jgi:hypothetical protein
VQVFPLKAFPEVPAFSESTGHFVWSECVTFHNLRRAV